MSARRRVNTVAAKKLLRKHAKTITEKAKSAAGSVKDFRLPGGTKRRPSAESSGQLKQYANLTSRGSTQKAKLNRREQKRRRKAEYLASLPKHPLKRLFYRLQPKRFFKYWFSRDGAVMALKLAGIGFGVAVLLGLGVFAYFRRELQGIDPRNITFAQSAQLYDRTGKTLLYTYGGDERRIVVELDQISPHMRNATIAIEDKDFYHHGGFSVTGITRAAWNNILRRDATGQGGSTITQQFIKNAVIKDTTQSYTRKVKELILAVELERLYTKDEILSFYLNQIPYGALEYGVEAAANGFFSKAAKNLTIDEAALLAAVPQAPSYYSPYGENLQDLVSRQRFIIELMEEQGYISQEEADAAKQVDTLKKLVPIGRRSAYRNIKAPHFVLKVINELIEDYEEAAVKTSGFQVITTIDLKAQKIAEKAIKDRYAAGGAMGDNAALVAEDTDTGQVIAYVGSRDFNFKGYGSFDAATPTIGRQPGSSFKPYAYAKLFENPRWSPGSIIWDSTTNFNGYAPHDFDFRSPGPMTVRDAIGRSRNIPAVKALYMAGVDNVIDLAQSMGLKTLCDTCDYGLSLVLGAGEVKLSEHVQGFSTFGRGGLYKPQTYILKVTDATGEVRREWKDGDGKEQVLDPQIAYSITSILTDDVARSGTFGLGSRLVVPGYTVAAKTGTTDLSVDGWLMGYSKYVTAGVWVGNHDSVPMYTFAEPMVGPIWNDFMVNYHKGKEDKKFEKPEGIKNVKIDRSTGRNASASSKSVINDIAPAWFKGVPSQDAQKVTIDTVSNKLATECTPDLARKEVSNTGVAPELDPSDPMFSAFAAGAGYSANSTKISQKDDVHKCSDDKPQISNFSVTGSGGAYQFEADYDAGTHSLIGGQINFKVNGQVVKSCKIPSSGCSSSSASYDYTSTFSGNATVVAEVIDKVLYSDDATENTSFSELDLVFTSPSDGENDACGPFCSVNWESVAGADDYEVCYWEDDVSQGCQTTPNSSYLFGATNGADYRVRVRAKSGGDTLVEGEIEFEA